MEDVRKVKEFVLAHRSKKDSKTDEKQKPEPPSNSNGHSHESENKAEEGTGEASALKTYLLNAHKTEQYIKPETGTNNSKKGLNQKEVMSLGGIKKMDVTNHLFIDLYKTVRQYMINKKFSICYKNAVSKAEIKIIFLIDSSSSMLQNKQIAFVKGIINQTFYQYKTKKISCALITLTNGTANLLLPLTTDKDALETAVKQLRTGGKTNLKAGLKLVHRLLKSQEKTNNLHQLFVLTDGQINTGETNHPFSETVDYYKTFLKFVQTTVIDMEKGFVRLGLAKQFATQINSRYQSIN